MDDDLPPDSKLTRSKQRWASEHRFITGTEDALGRERLPPGQHIVRDWPVLDLGCTPDIARDRWHLKIDGMVERQVTLDWAGLTALPQTELRSDIHCVTTWSRYDNDWKGVTTRDLIEAVRPKAEATTVMLHGYDGYTTNMLLTDFASDQAMIVHSWSGRPLTREHGGPVRVVIPHLYFWRSANG